MRRLCTNLYYGSHFWSRRSTCAEFTNSPAPHAPHVHLLRACLPCRLAAERHVSGSCTPRWRLAFAHQPTHVNIANTPQPRGARLLQVPDDVWQDQRHHGGMDAQSRGRGTFEPDILFYLLCCSIRWSLLYASLDGLGVPLALS